MSHSKLSTAYLQRFGGIARLYGDKQLQQLHDAHFLVAGIGGVGTWAAEAFARSGIGQITLVDLDDICVTNVNRQTHALSSTIGQSKVQVMAERLLQINPELQVNPVEDFLDRENLSEWILPQHDMVIDAMDAAHVKAALIAYCRARKIPVMTVGSAGGKTDPRCITSKDLGRTESDPMLSKVRQLLHRFHRFARDSNRRFRVEAVYSTEQMQYPHPDGSVCQQKSALQEGVKLDCSGGFGASSMVTGSFGFVVASRAIDRFLSQRSSIDSSMD